MSVSHRSARARLGRLLLFATALLPAMALATAARAGEVRAAVAANFTEAAREIAALYEAASGDRVILSFGSTGQLYAQISQGAPFEVFLAADRTRPEKAVEEGLAEPGSRFTYATGRLVLYSRDADLVRGETTLREGGFDRLAIANPATAPYGAAAVATLKRLGLFEGLEPRLVQGNNVAQTYQFVETGNAELGFVALSQVAGHRGGSRWIVPKDLHPAIAQDAVLLEPGIGSRPARAFLDFLKGPEARAVKERYGYGPGN